MSWTSSRSQCGWSTTSLLDRRPHDRADVGQALGLDQAVRDVDPEAVDPEVEPESHRLVELGSHVGVRPIDVGLLGREQVQVPLAGLPVRLGDAGPGRTAEVAQPVVGRLLAAGPAAVAEDEAGPLGRIRVCRERLLEPRMLVRDVVRDDVQQHPQAEVVRVADHRLGVGERPEHRLDGAEVRDVVAGVLHRRRVPRVDPQRVDAEVGEVAQARAESRRCRRPRRRRRRRSCGCRPGR